MKTRIYSIMDTTKKRTGITVLIVALIATIEAGMTFDHRSPKETGNEKIRSAAEIADKHETDHDAMDQYSEFLTKADHDPVTYYYNGRWVRSLYDENPNEKPVLYFNAVEDKDVAGKTAIHLRTIRNKETNAIERLVEMSESEVFQLLGNDQVIKMAMTQAKGSETSEEVPRSAKQASEALPSAFGLKLSKAIEGPHA